MSQVQNRDWFRRNVVSSRERRSYYHFHVPVSAATMSAMKAHPKGVSLHVFQHNDQGEWTLQLSPELYQEVTGKYGDVPPDEAVRRYFENP